MEAPAAPRPIKSVTVERRGILKVTFDDDAKQGESKSLLNAFAPVYISPSEEGFKKLKRCISEQEVLAEAMEIKILLADLLSSGSFSITGWKRSINKYWQSRNGIVDTRANGRDVTQMAQAPLFESGSTPVVSNLKPAVMMELHCGSCDRCRPYYAKHNTCDPKCYYYRMNRCIVNGWAPPVDRRKIVQQYSCKNSRNFDLFAESVKGEFATMVDKDVLIPLPQLTAAHVLNPLGVVIKNSDKLRALTLTGIKIIDQATMLAASTLLVQQGHPKIKARITTDCTASGVNPACFCPSFIYPGFAEALKKIRRNMFLAKADISRYFHSFPLSKEMMELLVVEYDESYYQFAFCPFGLRPCPYYASTWSAEIYRWMVTAGLDPAFMMDDWFEVGDTELDARARMAILSAILVRAGYDMAVDKFDYGQLMVFLGIRIDTTTMTTRIDPVQARGYNQQLKQYRATLVEGGLVDFPVMRSVVGKLGWYCEVLQSGRLHTDSLWDYLEYYDTRTQRNIIPCLIEDLDWWISIMDKWELDESSLLDNIIFNGSEIIANPSILQLVQSDASGPHGFGYVFSSYDDANYRFVSKRWCPANTGVFSHDMELRALRDYVVEHMPPQSLVMWISDCQPAVWSINKGNCRDPHARPILEQILESCDSMQCQIFATWVPREHNELTDFLSHFAYIMNRDEISGTRN